MKSSCLRAQSRALARPGVPSAARGERRVHGRAVQGQYNHIVPNMPYIQEVIEVFPEEGVANMDESMVLYVHGGYTMLDIRTESQLDRFGRIPKAQRAHEGGTSICVPYRISKRRFEDGKTVETEKDNPDFLQQVEKAVRNKDTKLLVLDFDGQDYAIEALEALYDRGFENIVGIQGGYKNWFKNWDNKLKRRNLGEYQEHAWGEGETSCGIHASGAGFDNQDAASADFWGSFN